MPKGRTDDAKTGPGEYEHPGGSVGAVRTRFLLQIRNDLPHVLKALRALDGSEPALLAWADDWRLRDRWTLDVARRAHGIRRPIVHTAGGARRDARAR